MTITLNLDSEKEARPRRQASRRGHDVAGYLLSLADADAPPPAAGMSPRKPQPRGSPEWKEALRGVGRGRTGAPLSIEATSRESIYEDDPRHAATRKAIGALGRN